MIAIFCCLGVLNNSLALLARVSGEETALNGAAEEEEEGTSVGFDRPDHAAVFDLSMDYSDDDVLLDWEQYSGMHAPAKPTSDKHAGLAQMSLACRGFANCVVLLLFHLCKESIATCLLLPHACMPL